MKFCTALTLIASAGYLATVLCSSNSGGVNGFHNMHVNATGFYKPALHGLAKRQNQQMLSLIKYAILGITDTLNGNSTPREQFTQNLVTALWNGLSLYNYIICHVDHDYSFQGSQGIDWDHVEIGAHLTGGTVNFDVVVGGAGSFTRHADGGFINWAYIGDAASRTDAGGDATVVFNAPTGINDPKRQNQQMLSLIKYAILGITDTLDYATTPREQFTQSLVTTLWDLAPIYNYIICHVGQDSYSFQGSQGIDWDQIEVVDNDPAAFVNFDVFIAGAGSFTRSGDGGPINWAYTGNVSSIIDNGPQGVTVVFNAP